MDGIGSVRYLFVFARGIRDNIPAVWGCLVFQTWAGIGFYIAGITFLVSAQLGGKPFTDGLLCFVIGTLWFATAPVEDK